MESFLVKLQALKDKQTMGIVFQTCVKLIRHFQIPVHIEKLMQFKIKACC